MDTGDTFVMAANRALQSGQRAGSQWNALTQFGHVKCCGRITYGRCCRLLIDTLLVFGSSKRVDELDVLERQVR